MARNLTLLIASIAVLVCAVPAAASAQPALTMPPGTLVPKNTPIVATSANLKIDTNSGLIACGSVALELMVVENSGTKIFAIPGTGVGEASNCFLEGEEVQVTDVTPKQMQAGYLAKGGLALTFEVDLPGMTCHFVKELQFAYPLGEGDEISVDKQSMKVTPESCGAGEIEADFTLETPAANGGGSVIFQGMPGATLTQGGALASPGTILTFTSSNLRLQTSFGTINCGSTVINSELTKNSNSVVAGVGVGEGSVTECFGGGSPKFTDVTLKQFETGLQGEGSMNLTFKVDIASGSCHFESKPGGLKFSYKPGSDELSIANQSLAVTPAGCGSGSIQAALTVESKGGNLVLD